MKRLLLCVLAAAGLSACVSSHMTPQSMRGLCLSSADPNCFPLCDEYRNLVMEEKFTAKKTCRQACEDLHKRQAATNAVNKCEPTNAQGEDLCNLYCNQHFDD